MEGNQVGKTDADVPTRTADFDNDDLLWPNSESSFSQATLPTSVRTDSDPDSLNDDLIWPDHTPHHDLKPAKPAFACAVLTFIVATIFAFALGPMQLILLAFTQDYDFVISTYYPAALRLTLLSSGIFMLINIVALILSFRSSKHRFSVIITLCTGSLALFAVAWVAAFLVDLQPNQLTIIVLPLILIFWFAALMVSKSFSTETEPPLALKILAILLILGSSAEIIFDGVYIFTKTAPDTPAVDLSELIHNELAARPANLPEQLAKFTFALCDGPYDIVFITPDDPNSGLFECQNTHEVYSIADSEISQDASRFAEATYLGQTYHPTIENIFPGVSYLYRDLSSIDLGLSNELISLLPSDSEETLIDQNFSAIATLAASEPNLNLSIFYTDPLDTELPTRDYILTTAVGTLALVDWLPRGNVYTGADTPDIALRYSFTTDRVLSALQALGLDPGAYSEQVRDAITNRRHLQINTSILDLSDENALREQLLASFVDPA